MLTGYLADLDGSKGRGLAMAAIVIGEMTKFEVVSHRESVQYIYRKRLRGSRNE